MNSFTNSVKLTFLGGSVAFVFNVTRLSKERSVTIRTLFVQSLTHTVLKTSYTLGFALVFVSTRVGFLTTMAIIILAKKTRHAGNNVKVVVTFVEIDHPIFKGVRGCVNKFIKPLTVNNVDLNA